MATRFRVAAQAPVAAPTRLCGLWYEVGLPQHRLAPGLRTSKRCTFSSGSSPRLTASRQAAPARRAAVLPRAEILWTLEVDKKQPGSASIPFETLNLTELMDCRRKGPNNTCTITVGAGTEEGEFTDVSLPVDTVSNMHAEFEEDGDTGALFVTDLGSTNGTFLNNKRVEGKTEVHAGDRISFGGEPVFVCLRNALAHA